MKKTILILLAGMMMIGTGCNNNTYSNLRNKEKKLIKNYISRNNLNILTEEPDEDYVWGEKDYYQVSGYDELYFHLRKRGDKESEIKANDVIIARYKKFQLEENADTLSYWTTLDQAYPYEFTYGNSSTCEATGWHVAVMLMKYSDAECEVIVPSKLGFDAEQMSVTPYVYILRVKVKN